MSKSAPSISLRAGRPAQKAGRFDAAACYESAKAHPLGYRREAREKRPEWFEHLLRKAETKAAKIAAQAALSPYACGDATFAEVFAKTLPTLFTEALERLDSPEPD